MQQSHPSLHCLGRHISQPKTNNEHHDVDKSRNVTKPTKQAYQSFSGRGDGVDHISNTVTLKQTVLV
jgi:hypothetical protein